MRTAACLRIFCAPVASALVLAACGGAPSGDSGRVDFNVSVRPILSDNCMSCHGPDAGSRKAGLRLDGADSATAELPESPGKYAIVPGSPEKSELIRRITASDPEERMPPLSSHKTLSEPQIDTLRTWIKQGAEYAPHWAYVKPTRKPIPAISSEEGFVVNPIDAYVIAGQRSKGLQPSAEADRETLINRVALDLTGLPPTLEEVDRFVSSTDPKAYEKLVDTLLASPRYGERMAASWMDVARYSESDGYLDDMHSRLFWPWRDWIVSAFNRNLPFDRFVSWQLAGDLIPNATKEQILATAFGRLGKRSTENGIIDEEYRVTYMNERTDLVGKAFLGLTVGCAQCHDHKYDAISQEDYYSLGAFFNNIDERGFYAAGFSNRTVGPTLAWPDAATSDRQIEAQSRLAASEAAYAAEREKAQRRAEAQVDALLASTPAAIRTRVLDSTQKAVVAYYPLDQTRPPLAGEIARDVMSVREPRNPPDAAMDRTARGARGNQPVLPNGLIATQLTASPSGQAGVGAAFLQGAVQKPGIKGNAFQVDGTNIGFLARKVGWFERTQPFAFSLWIRLPPQKIYADATVVNHRDHNVISGDSGYTLNLENNHLRFDLIHASPHNMVSVRAASPVPNDAWVHVAVSYDGSSRADGVRIYVDGEPAGLETRKDNLSRTILPTLMAGSLGGDYYGFAFGFRFREEVFAGGLVDEIRLYDRSLAPVEVRLAYAPDTVLTPDSAQLRNELKELLWQTDPQVVAAAKSLEASREALNVIDSSLPQIMVMGDTPTPRKAYLLERGVYNMHGREVQARGPEKVFRWDPALPRNRLGLASWLFDKDNPLTSRVMVNRLWAMHFGRGIVDTVEDFGTQGSNPTHPELLDWLAVEFVESGWDLKHLHKLIVLSATYRQSSDATPADLEADPQNLLLARYPRTRLPAEMIRDNALSSGGLLADTIGGPSVHPYQPGGVWEATGSRHRYPMAGEVPDDEHHRRSMYTFVKRNAQAPSMVVFDFADRNVSSVNRPVSNTPLQALVLLNDPQFREAYRALADRVLQRGRDEDDVILDVFRLAIRRQPTEAELEVLTQYYRSQIDAFKAAPNEARAVLTVGVSAPSREHDVVQFAALTSVAAVVMNTPDAYSLH